MIRASILALLGLASFVAVYVWTAPGDAPVHVAESGAPGAPEPSEGMIADAASLLAAPDKDTSRIGGTAVTFQLRPSAEQEPTPETFTSSVRDVTPSNMTAGPAVTGPLTRVEPPKPEAPPPPQAREERVFNPIIIAAGAIKVRDRDIRLAGISAPNFDASCGEGANAWPCGQMARAALRRFVRARAIVCDVPEGAEEIPNPATCRVAGEDIAAWLVARGWAKRNGERYGEQEDAAREAKLGLWGDKRPDAQAEVAASG